MSDPFKPFSFGFPLKNRFAEFVYMDHVMMPHEITQIQKLWQEDVAEKAGLAGGQTYKEDLRKTSILGIQNVPENEWLYEKLAMSAVSANQEIYHFDLMGFYEPLQLMKYGHDDFFDWHLDFGIGQPSERKLSVTIQLSDPNDYEGGELQFMVNQNIVTAKKDRGTMIVFPSFMLHRVTPVTKGMRQSIVGWVAGVPYR